MPRFSAENAANNTRVVDALGKLAAERGMTKGRRAITWARAKQPGYVPLIGTRTPEQLNDALGALEHPLSKTAVAELERLIPADAVTGTRYDKHQMAMLDSER